MEQEEMPKRRLDLLGFFCPIPVHETRKALSEMQEGELLEVYGDDPETLLFQQNQASHTSGRLMRKQRMDEKSSAKLVL